MKGALVKNVTVKVVSVLAFLCLYSHRSDASGETGKQTEHYYNFKGTEECLQSSGFPLPKVSGGNLDTYTDEPALPLLSGNISATGFPGVVSSDSTNGNQIVLPGKRGSHSGFYVYEINHSTRRGRIFFCAPENLDYLSNSKPGLHLFSYYLPSMGKGNPSTFQIKKQSGNEYWGEPQRLASRTKQPIIHLGCGAETSNSAQVLLMKSMEKAILDRFDPVNGHHRLNTKLKEQALYDCSNIPSLNGFVRGLQAPPTTPALKTLGPKGSPIK